MTEHPITPPPELVEQWRNEWIYKAPGDNDELGFLAARAAQWGTDQELEACCRYFARDLRESLALELRAARRPKPPSLKEQALEALRHVPGPGYPNPITLLTADEHALIRRALEQLDD
jgi:hypothetical protein